MTMNDRSSWIALYVLCLGDIMIVLDGTIVNVALPSIRDDLGFSQESLAWIVNAYLLTFGGFLLLGGRLGDLFGHRRLFLIGIALFTAASLGCGLANSQGLLIAGRAVQGVGGAIVSAVALSLLMLLFTEHGGPREGDGGVRLRPLGRRRDRRAGRRHPHRPAQLALDLPRQPPGRRDGVHPVAAFASGRARPGRDRQGRLRRRDHRDLCVDARRLRDRERQRAGVGLGPDARHARRVGGAHRDLPRDRVTSRLAARPARAVPQPQRLDVERRRRAHGRGHVLLLLLLRALPPARARVLPDGGRPRVPARHHHLGRVLALPLAEARDALRDQAAAARRAGADDARARAARSDPGRRQLGDRHPARDDRARDRRRNRVQPDPPRCDERRRARAGRARFGSRQHVVHDGRRGGSRDPRQPRRVADRQPARVGRGLARRAEQRLPPRLPRRGGVPRRGGRGRCRAPARRGAAGARKRGSDSPRRLSRARR